MEPSVTSNAEHREAIAKLTKDLRIAARSLTPREVRYVVDMYYQLQRFRTMTASMVRSSVKEAEKPHELIQWICDQSGTLERRIPPVMREWASVSRPGRWALSIHGIGPVIAAGLLSHIDITRAPTVGHVWRFAGLDPTLRWGKKERRPWNAKLKVLCWKIGESFCKLRGSENDIYGKVYETRKELEKTRNERGDFIDQAASTLKEKNFRGDSATKTAYESGRLPDGRIDLRAKRYAVKLFLSHLHHVMYECEYGKQPPKPYILTQPEHVHFVAPPLWPCE